MPRASTVIEIGDIRIFRSDDEPGERRTLPVRCRHHGLAGSIKSDRSHHAAYREYVDAIPP
jgi:hypothetical protein